MADLLTIVKENFLFILMFLGIIGSMIKDFMDKAEIVIKDVGEFDPAHERIIPKSTLVHIALIAFLVVLTLLYKMFSESREFIQEASYGTPKRRKYFANRISPEEYNRQAAEMTRKEQEKLFRSAAYQRMLQEKGEDRKNWVWQTSEKQKKAVWKDNDDSEELDHLSKISMTDD